MTHSSAVVRLSRAAQKDVDKPLRAHAAQVFQALARLRDDPHLGHPLTGRLKGARSLEFSLRGIGECRAVYIVIDSDDSDPVTCLVVIVGPHENIYDRAEPRLDALRRAGDA